MYLLRAKFLIYIFSIANISIFMAIIFFVLKFNLMSAVNEIFFIGKIEKSWYIKQLKPENFCKIYETFLQNWET